MLSPNKLLLVLFAVLVGVRFVYLGIFPSGLNHDEIEKVMSVQSIISHGVDISGVGFPESLVLSNTSGGQNNFLPLSLSFLYRTLPLNIVTVRIPFVLLTLLTGLLLSDIVRKLTRREILSRFVLFVSLINPWMWFVGRSVTEANFALFFVTLGIWFLENKKMKYTALSAISFICAFLSYWGVTLVLPVIVVLVLATRYVYTKSRSGKGIATPLILFSVFLVIFGIALLGSEKTTFGNRRGELIFQNLDRYAEQVRMQRTESIETPLTPILANKVTLLTQDVLQKYLALWSPSYLFFNGDPRATYTFGDRGVLYVLDALFIVIGIVFLSQIKRTYGVKRLLSYGIILMIFAPLSSAVSTVENSYVFRSILTLPVFIVLIASGMTFLAEKSKYALYVIVSLSLLLFVNFLGFYFFEYPVTHQENQFWSEHVVVDYARRASADTSVAVITSYPTHLAQKYLFATSRQLNESVLRVLYNPPIQIENVMFTSKCVDDADILIIQDGLNCEPQNLGKPTVIQNYADSGSLWKIYRDSLCNFTTLGSYRAFHSISDYTLEEMDLTQFCQRQIHKYD